MKNQQAIWNNLFYYQQSNLILILQITTHLGHDHGIDGHLAHAGRGPLEGKGVSY